LITLKKKEINMIPMKLFLVIFLANISIIFGQNNNVTTHVVVTNTTIVCQSPDVDALQRTNNELKETIIQMWNALNSRLDVLDARLSCVSNCSIPEVLNSTTTPSPVPELEQKIYQNLTINENWKLVYDQPYSHITTNDDLVKAASVCSNQVLVGASYGANESQLVLAAVGPVEVLTHQTALNKPVQFGDVFWYNTAKNSFGFSPTKIITQGSADTNDKSSALRLSWHVDERSGGYRAGAATELNGNTIWRKLIYCLNSF
jgi:hypothetical protein